jgi:hypothetical protein
MPAISRFDSPNQVAMARCAVRVAYQRRNVRRELYDGRNPVPPAGTRAGTSQRDVPTSICIRVHACTPWFEKRMRLSRNKHLRFGQ